MFDFYQHCEDNDLSSSSSFVLVISPLNALMIDQITELKDHVNVSIMKAVHVNESKDAMYSLREPLYMDNDSSKIIFAHAEALLKDKKQFVYGGREGALEVGQELSDKGYQHYQVSNRGRAMIFQAVVIL